MANLPETETYEAGITQLETTTPALGGAGGPLNAPLAQLANRTKWLKGHVEGKVSKSGDIMTGNLEIKTAGPTLALNKTASAQTAYLAGSTNGATRWTIEPGNATPEAGANAGSDLAVSRYDDAGAYIDTPLSINRKTGIVQIGGSRAEAFPSGTRMLFMNTAAPAGWTKDTNPALNHALRVTGGTVGSGGTTGFTDVFASRGLSGTVGATTLSIAQMPSHNHTVTSSYNWLNNTTGTYYGNWSGGSGFGALYSGIAINNTGGGGSHTHSLTMNALNMSVLYCDVIVATKD